MALNKLKFNSINVTPAASKALKFNSSANGFETVSAGGAMTFIKKLTASSSSTLSFVDGSSDVVLDNTYKEYIFIFNNIHPQTEGTEFGFNMSVDSGSNYNVTKTSTFFLAYNYESGGSAGVSYHHSGDLAQGTGLQQLATDQGADSDASLSGTLHLFNPSSTTFVKHFIATTNELYLSGAVNSRSNANYIAGYGNTTSAIDGVQFKMNSGNIDAGTITLYGIN